MKVKNASNSLKVLLILFSIGVVLLGVYILPRMAENMLSVYPELVHAKSPVLIMCEVLLSLLLLGLGNIMYLIILFDRDSTFTLKFTRALDLLIGLCLIATLGLVILFKYVSTLGGPGPLPSIVMVGMIFVILIIAMVISLIRAIVNKTIFYKNDYDLTV